ncbi:MAG: hypothetical protein IT208_09435 [Chthonomonadales bacterium]|nr:hypothetical protein [Chthonomonadales bacterium]
MRRYVGLLTAFALVAPAASASAPVSPIDAIAARFANPPRAHSPAPIWWWSRERLDLRRLDWQMDRMLAGHVHNAVILSPAPIGGRYGSEPDDPPFFSEEWWRILKRVLARARAVGMRVWLYDHPGLTASIESSLMERYPECRSRALAVEQRDVVGPTSVRMGAQGASVAASAVALTQAGTPGGRVLDLSAALRGGLLDARLPPGRWRVMLFHEAPGGFDYLSRRSAARLLDHVHGQYARRVGPYLGRTVPGTIQDELRTRNRWTSGLLAEFRRRKGYDLRRHLPRLWYDLGPLTSKARCDLADVQSALAEEAYVRPLIEWHRRHGMLCSNDQSTRDADPVAAQDVHIDCMRTLRWLQAPTKDQTRRSRPHSPPTHLYARPRAWLEGFRSAGWGQTLEDLSGLVLAGYLQGANHFSPPAFHYTTRAGWWEWAPSCASFRQPYWRHYRLFSDHVTRLSYALSQGRHACDVAVLYPSASVQAALRLGAPATPGAAAVREAYRSTVRRLEAAGRDYDILDEPSLRRAQVNGGHLTVASESYRALLLPGVTTLSRGAARRARQFVAAGGLVCALGMAPDASPEHGAGDPEIARFSAELFGLAPTSTGLTSRRIGRGLAVRAPVTGLAEVAAWLDERLGRDVTGEVRALRRRVSGAQIFLVNGPAGRSLDVGFRATGSAEVWDPWTGSRSPLRTRRDAAGMATTRLSFADSSALLVVFRGDGALKRRVEPRRPASLEVFPARAGPEGRLTGGLATRDIPLAGEWATELVPTLDNRWGDFAWPARPGSPPVECRVMRYREEGDHEDGVSIGFQDPEYADASWERVTATFGPYWWVTRPGVALTSEEASALAAGQGEPDSARWMRWSYSRRYGIEKDPAHQRTLGPRGRVPDDLFDLGEAPSGTVRYALTYAYSPAPAEAVVRRSCTGACDVLVNGTPVRDGAEGRVRLVAGYNLVLLRLTHPAGKPLRAWVLFGPASDGASRLAWIWHPAPDGGQAVRFFRAHLRLDDVPSSVTAVITADDGYELRVNGARAGSGFGAGDSVWQTAERYEIAPLLRPGDNVVAVRARSMDGPGGLLAALCAGEGPAVRTLLATGGEWRASADGPEGWATPAFDDSGWPAARVVGQYPCAPWGAVAGFGAAAPAIMPESGWLNRTVAREVAGLIYDVLPGLGKRIGWYRFRTPPGARAVRLSVWGRYWLYIGGRECSVGTNGVAAVPEDLRAAGAVCALRVRQAAGRYGGAALERAVTFDCGPGRATPGPWAARGLPSYSGGLRYERTIDLSAAQAAAPLALDLGRVRGTAEVSVNGRPAGVRIWRPYRFRLAGLLRPGPNRIAVVVYNTLAPWFGAGYPTPYVYPGQELSGLLGPVRLTDERRGPPRPVGTDGLPNYADL